MGTGFNPRNICVVGAGTMGSGIAAHFANLGFQVSLLDATQSSVIEAFEKARNARPPHFYTPERAGEIRLGNVSEHQRYLGEADWVIEAIVERPEAKRALYAELDDYIRPDAWVSTNTSGLEISLLAAGRSASFRRRFVGTHFFNPPRYLKLLELIPTPETDATLVDEMAKFLEEMAARRVVLAKDTPGFIANRFGMWSMFQAVHVAERLHLSIEEVDAITGVFLGRPKSASFRLNDIVGLDIMRDIAANLVTRCPHDPHIGTLELPSSMLHLLARGWIGEKAGQGYYRREGGEFLALDLSTFAYRNRRDVKFASIEKLGRLPLGERISQALDLRDEVGEYLRHYLIPVLRYAHSMCEEVSHSVLDFDRVMEWGFGWEKGPFAMIDALGAERVGLSGQPFYDGGRQRTFEGAYVSIPKPPEYAKLTDYPIISRGESLVTRDLGDGIAAVGFTAKMGVLSPEIVNEFTHLLEDSKLDRFVLASEAKAFSAGFDLRFFLAAIAEERWEAIDEALQKLQHLGAMLEKRKVVVAAHGFCLGGGLELALSCSVIAASAECQIGLPESRVGLIPAGRGTTLTRVNNQHNARRLTEVAITLAHGTIAPTADQARSLGYLRPTDVTVYHPDRLIFEAKQLALTAEPLPRPVWGAVPGPLPGMIDRELEVARTKGDLSEYDHGIGLKLKQIFARSTGVPDALTRERTEFLDLCHNALTVARLKHMIETNKPLRN